jgi:selenide, water dikinase
MVSMGMVPEGQSRNRANVKDLELSRWEGDEKVIDCLFDPQTSGGLLAAVDPADSDIALGELRAGPCPRASAVGVVLQQSPRRLSVRRGGSA